MKTIVIGMPHSRRLAARIARRLRVQYAVLWSVPFPDGESHLRFTKSVKGKRVVLVQSMHPDPNRSMIEAVFTAYSAKELGAAHVDLVAPYLAYMRQDKSFRPLECRSNWIMAQMLSCCRRVLAIDPHLHRIKDLKQIFKSNKAICLSASASIGAYLRRHHSDALVVGPDAESYQWANRIAKHLSTHAVILRKKRYNSYTVRIKVPKDIDFRGRDVVIVDDIISTGHTILEPARQIKRRGAKRIHVIAVHGVFAAGALRKLQKSGLHVLTTNTIETPVSKIDISEVIAEALR